MSMWRSYYTAGIKILPIGTAGFLGLRLVAALLNHGQTVVAFVRPLSKLESLATASILQRTTVIEDDALNSAATATVFCCHAEGVAALERSAHNITGDIGWSKIFRVAETETFTDLVLW
ncbi:NAD(P)-binding protein [Venturia nashicola]|nr:NAD(P)-binding protein [Venturia nashicola]